MIELDVGTHALAVIVGMAIGYGLRSLLHWWKSKGSHDW